jgi:hypothetical protein
MEGMGEGDASSDIRPFEERCEAHATAACCCCCGGGGERGGTTFTTQKEYQK